MDFQAFGGKIEERFFASALSDPYRVAAVLRMTAGEKEKAGPS